MRRPKIVLLITPMPFVHDQKRNAPLGIMYVAAMLEQDKHDVSIVDLRDMDTKEAIRNVPDADIYGFSATSLEYHIAVKIAEGVRKRHTKSMLVLGGFHATVSPLDTLCAVFNVILKGEGEYAVLDIVKDWESLIPARKFVYNPQRITNLELLPFPARHLLPFDSVFHKGLVDPRKDDYGTTLTTSRGCPFNCSFCLPENTKVLTADMQWLHIQDIKVGDTVVGIDSRRRYASSRVTNTFKRQAEVYAIETEGGTVFSTKEHPWLMHNGWKSIKDIEDNLKYNARFDSTRAVLRKLSTPAIALKPSDDYKKGYISGAIVGDGHLRRRADTPLVKHGLLRLCIVGDYEMLDRTLEYANDLNIHMHERKFNGGKYYRCNRCVVCERHSVCETIEKMIYQAEETREYTRGFLAGIYDAEGSFSRCNLRICNNDEKVKDRIIRYLEVFGFQFARESKSVRIVGGQPEQIRFLSLVCPNVRHKREALFGQRVYNSSAIISVYPIGVRDVYNLSTTTENFVADGFITHNCGSRKVWGRKVTYNSVNRVVEEIKDIIDKFGVRQFRFYDDTITLNKKRLKELSYKLAPLGIVWRCHARVDELDEETCKMLMECGCDEVAIGVETASQEALDSCGKRITVEQSKQGIKTAKECGLKVKAFFIIGLPKDFGDVSRRDIEFIEECKPDAVNLSTLSPFPGSKLYDTPEAYGLKFRTDDISKYRMCYGLWGNEADEDFAFEYDEMSNEQLKYHRRVLLEYIQKKGLDLNR